ncbi:MAG: TetR/AcrR family transcriptional regulator [Spirochaetes bacterium]|nr:TetR/AcrR family transcriptional regulator [Spirochaetota bacterium]
MIREYLNTNLRRKQIIDAISKIILEKGSEFVTIRSISKAINLSEAAIYRHFKNKKEIFIFLIDNLSINLIDNLLDINRINSIDDLFHVFKNHIISIERIRGISFLIIAEILSLGDSDLNEKLLENINKYLRKIESVIKKCLDDKIIKKSIDPHVTALILFNNIQGMVYNWYINRFNYDLIDKFNLLWEHLKHIFY